MNVFVGRDFVGSFDNTKWTEENGRVPWVDIGREHVNEYIYQQESSQTTQERKDGTTKFCSKRSDEGTLG